MKLWVRHCVRETAKVFGLLLGCFFLLYIMIDYSVHSNVLGDASPPFGELLRYYLFQFVKRAHILLPFALLVSTIKVISTLNVQGTLVTLRVAGVSAQQLLAPFLGAALVCTFCLWGNFQLIYPKASGTILAFEQSYFHGGSHTKGSHLHAVRLKDNSHLLFQAYNQSSATFFDAIWLRGPGELYRIKELHAAPGKVSQGIFVDLLKRNGGAFEKVTSFAQQTLDELRLDKKALRDALTPAENLSMLQLWHRYPGLFKEKTDQQAAITTQLLVKLLLPLICLLVVLGPAPFLFRFSRRRPIFFIYTFAIIAFLSLLTGIDAAAILGESRVASPALIVGLPFAALMAGAGTLYARLR
jgi:lipopolysaccharide export system permease protein